MLLLRTSGFTRLICSVAMEADALATHSGVGGAVAWNWMPAMRSRSRTCSGGCGHEAKRTAKVGSLELIGLGFFSSHAGAILPQPSR
jgi:hypothetical protein